MKKLLSITVKGKSGAKYSFNFFDDPIFIKLWRRDGIEVEEVLNTFPDWLPWFLVKPWCQLQDLFNFKW